MLLIALIASIVFLSILFFVEYSNESWGDGLSSLYFGHSINLSNNTGVSESAITVLSGNNVYVVWQDNSTGNGDIYFRRSIDGGQIFDDILNISNNSGSSQTPQIAVSGNNVYVVWQDNSTGNGDIYFRRSIDGGQIFDDILNISNNSGSSQTPQIAVSGNNVYVVWQDNSTGNGDIYFRRSIDGGQIFDDILNISNNSGSSQTPQIAVSGNNVYVVWQDNSTGNGDIYFRRSIDGGQIFDDILNISNNSGSSQTPQIAVSGNNVYVVWQDNSTGNGDIYLKGSFNNGENFAKRRNISDDPGSSQLPQIAVSEDNSKVIWINDNGTSSSVFSKSGNMTQLRGLQKFASGTDTESLKLKVSDENVFAVWTSDLGNRQVIMFNPFSFPRQDPEELVLSNVNGSSSSPSISTFGSNTFVVWQDSSTGSSDVYVKKISSTFFERDIKK